jgi:hypothetical protein
VRLFDFHVDDDEEENVDREEEEEENVNNNKNVEKLTSRLTYRVCRYTMTRRGVYFLPLTEMEKEEKKRLPKRRA